MKGESVKKPRKIKKPTDTEAKFRKELLKLLENISDKLEFLCQDVRRNRG